MKRQRDPPPLCLLPHQQEGVKRILANWCTATYLAKSPTTAVAAEPWEVRLMKALLLHDEMGLGKTVQALEAVRRMMSERLGKYPHTPQLVVAPASCLHVWQAEIERWFSTTELGSDVRVFISETATSKTLEHLTFRSIVITSYATLRTALQTCLSLHLSVGSLTNAELVRLCLAGNVSNPHALRALFANNDRTQLLKLTRTAWNLKNIKFKQSKNPLKSHGYDVLMRTNYGCAVFDEIHMVKNVGSKTCKAVAFVSAQYRLGLSGTPMMNHGGEMLTILKYGLALWDADWPLIYREPNGTYCRGLLKSACFGRQKKDVPEIQHLIPNRDSQEDEQLVLDWTNCGAARDLYVKIRRDSLATLEMLKSMRPRPGESRIDFAERRKQHTRHFWTQFQQLRQVCLHHFLLVRENTDVPLHFDYNADTSFAFPAWVQQRCTLISLCALRVCNAPQRVRDTLCKWVVRAERYTIQPSPKMQLFWQMLQKPETKKVAAVSSSRQFLEHILGPWLERNGVCCALFSGGSRHRQHEVLQAFHCDPALRVLMVVKTAGAHGLNLQEDAATVVIFDPHFNEALDEQAAQRVDRLGQREDHVTIRKLYMRGSVDEAMRSMQQRKQAQTQAWIKRTPDSIMSLETVGLFLEQFDSVGESE